MFLFVDITASEVAPIYNCFRCLKAQGEFYLLDSLKFSQVKRVLQDPDGIKQLIVATPALKKDTVALCKITSHNVLLHPLVLMLVNSRNRNFLCFMLNILLMRKGIKIFSVTK